MPVLCTLTKRLLEGKKKKFTYRQVSSTLVKTDVKGIVYSLQVIYTLDGITFTNLADLPVPNHSHCAAVVDYDRLAVVGGHRAPKQVFVYRKSMRAWDASHPNMTEHRAFQPFCGVVDGSGNTGRQANWNHIESYWPKYPSCIPCPWWIPYL